ncbi:hypothetical protein DB347_16640 [Opitutaceae bacterium EW11]|nr:hypothetical protein DB347_16640 [Opitutaceae bacterium EW11]
MPPLALDSPPVRRPAQAGFWTLYDRLAQGVSSPAPVRAFAGGLHWFSVEAAGSLGLAMAPKETAAAPSLAGGVAGRELREISALAKSWNSADAALGVAALNSHYNAPDRVLSWARASHYVHLTGSNAFETMLPRVSGRRVAVIGHFRHLDEFARHCDLTILERRPQPGDMPDPACEVVLPDAEFVFITATTLINKTLPRLLQLCPQAFVVLVGPTTPLAPVWFDLGVDMVAGLLIDDVPAVQQIVQEGGQHTFFDRGTRFIQIERRTGHAAQG